MGKKGTFGFRGEDLEFRKEADLTFFSSLPNSSKPIPYKYSNILDYESVKKRIYFDIDSRDNFKIVMTDWIDCIALPQLNSTHIGFISRSQSNRIDDEQSNEHRNALSQFGELIEA